MHIFVGLKFPKKNLTIRKCSHIGQKINGDIENITYIFLRKRIKERIDNIIYDNIECIVNLDETPCYIENPSKETINIKDVKKVEIITYDKEKCRITAILSISASGYKLPPLLILKGQTGKKRN